jgi:acetyl esterase/lipase
MIFIVGRLAIADENGTAPARVKLTDQSIRSEKRLYRHAPEGDLYLHIYYPPGWKAEDQRPAIVFFFGGGWKAGSYLKFVPHAEYFASRGLVAASADYRTLNKHHTTPDKAVEDARSAMRWMRSHARELGVDGNKLIASGGSAGGHLAASTAVLDDFNAADDDASISCRPAALVLFNPVVDLTHLPERKLAEDSDATMKERLSPSLHLDKNAPPSILFYGTGDKFFPQGEAYVAKARELGVRTDLYVAPQMKHGFFNSSPWTEVTVAQADEFLASLGYLHGSPTVKVPADAPQLEKK